jgi:hypothetical protein
MQPEIMTAIEILLFAGIAVLGVYASKSDIICGKIRNKVLLAALLFAVVLDALYYIFYAKELLVIFLVNNVFVWIITAVLYFTHSWAGGDCKFCFLLALMYPARYYLTVNQNSLTLFFSTGIAFILGYFFLAGDAVYCLLMKKIRLTKQYVLQSIKAFLFSYFSAILYTTAASFVFQALASKVAISLYLQTAIHICLAWFAASKKQLQNRIVLGILLFADLVLSVVTRTIPISTNYQIYLIMLILLFFQIAVRIRNYQTVAAKAVQPGMILSAMSSALLMQSNISSIQKLSKETLDDRLTRNQAAEIQGWGERTQALLTIVRKVPFSVFIFLGIVGYFILWGAMR